MTYEKSYYWLKDRIIPGLRNSQYIYVDELRSIVNKKSVWLDVGCGHQMVPEFIPHAFQQEKELIDQSKMTIGIDYDFDSLKKNKNIKYKVRGDIHHLPFKSGSFDMVTANMVVEHIQKPFEVLKDVNRLLKTGGSIVFHTPNKLNYAIMIARLFPDKLKSKLVYFFEKRKEEDVFPTYYRLNSLRQIADLARQCGFEVIKLITVESNPVTYRLGPLSIFELLLLKLLRLPMFSNFRSNIIAVLNKCVDKNS